MKLFFISKIYNFNSINRSIDVLNRIVQKLLQSKIYQINSTYLPDIKRYLQMLELLHPGLNTSTAMLLHGSL